MPVDGRDPELTVAPATRVPQARHGKVATDASVAGNRGESTIRTPDQRVRVFVSSTLRELAAERAAAQSAITRLHLTPTMFELGARPHPPRDLYRSYLAQSEVFVGIYCRQYGWVAPGEEVSGLEDEYLLSAGMPKLIYVKAAAEREPRLVDLLDRVKADDQASYKPFGDAEDLGELLADDLAVLLTERFAQSAASPALGWRPATPPTPQTAIVGREGEIATVVALLRDPDVRLVTLIGSGGIGKTRLALEVARLAGWRHRAPRRCRSWISLRSTTGRSGLTCSRPRSESGRRGRARWCICSSTGFRASGSYSSLTTSSSSSQRLTNWASCWRGAPN